MTRALAGYAAFVALALVLFARTLGIGYLSDDFTLVRGVVEGGPLGIATFGQKFFRPTTSISLWLDLQLFGLHLLGAHAVNVALHAASACFVGRIGSRLGLSPGAAWVAALWFLVAPAHAEAVAWIACRSDLLATATGLSALWIWLEADASPGHWLRAVALLLLCVALLSKESAAPLALVLAVWELARRFRTARALALTRAAIPTLLLASFVVLRRLAIGSWIGGYGEIMHTRFEIGRIVSSIAAYTLRALTGPVPGEYVTFDRPLVGLFEPVTRALSRPAVVIAVAAVLIATTVLVLRLGWKNQAFRFCAPAYAVVLLPVLNLGVSMINGEGERFLYLPSAMLVLAVTAAAWALSARVRVRGALAALALVFSLFALPRSLSPWRDAGTLTRALVPQIAEAAHAGPVTLLNVPDNVRGAYVLRNGLPDALALLHPGSQAVAPVILHGVIRPDDVVQMEMKEDGAEVHLGDRRSWIFAVSPPAGLSIEGAAVGENHVQLRGEFPPNTFIMSGGALQPLARN